MRRMAGGGEATSATEMTAIRCSCCDIVNANGVCRCAEGTNDTTRVVNRSGAAQSWLVCVRSDVNPSAGAVAERAPWQE